MLSLTRSESLFSLNRHDSRNESKKKKKWRTKWLHSLLLLPNHQIGSVSNIEDRSEGHRSAFERALKIERGHVVGTGLDCFYFNYRRDRAICWRLIDAESPLLASGPDYNSSACIHVCDVCMYMWGIERSETKRVRDHRRSRSELSSRSFRNVD